MYWSTQQQAIRELLGTVHEIVQDFSLSGDFGENMVASQRSWAEIVPTHGDMMPACSCCATFVRIISNRKAVRIWFSIKWGIPEANCRTPSF